MFTLIVLDDIEWNTEKQNSNLPETIYIRIPHAMDPRNVNGNDLIKKIADEYEHMIVNLRVRTQTVYSLELDHIIYMLQPDGTLTRIYQEYADIPTQ